MHDSQELKELFEEWLKGMESRVLEMLKEGGPANPVEVAAGLGISVKAAIILICSMATAGRLKIGEIRSNEG